MNVLLREVTIVNGNDALKGQKKDILITDGRIARIGDRLEAPQGATVFHHPGACVSVGWVDMKANFRDPGHETEESISSGLAAAAAGGFTGVVLMPSTTPVVQSKTDVEYLIGKSSGHAVSVYPAGALSVNREGKDITEMYDMKQAGAVAFTDDKRPVTDSGLMMRALQYSGNLNALVISYADDAHISGKGMVNEGVPAVVAGMKGAPAFAEELMVFRDIRISEYTGVPVHFSTLSTAAAVERVREAKGNGGRITAEVTAHHLYFDDTVIPQFDSNHKVKPPYRSTGDRDALRKAVADGTIDVICSDHSPEDLESKEVEFDFAAYGIIGLETAFAVARTALGTQVPVSRLADCFSVNPRRILNLGGTTIAEGEPACLTVFDPEMKWTYASESIRSRSANSPFIGVELQGKPLAICNNGRFVTCN